MFYQWKIIYFSLEKQNAEVTKVLAGGKSRSSNDRL